MDQDLGHLGAQVELGSSPITPGPVPCPDLTVTVELHHLTAAAEVSDTGHLPLPTAQQQLWGGGVEGQVPHHLPAQAHEAA